MHTISVIMAAGLAFGASSTALAQSPLEQGFAGALKGCEEWVLNPASWADGFDPFIRTIGLGSSFGLVDQIDEVALPPAPMRRGNRFWRINSTPSSGFILVVSDQLPICHITGGGNADLQPIVRSVLSSATFGEHWQKVKASVQGDLVSSTFQNRDEPNFSIVVSHAKSAGERLDRVQVIATAVFNLNP